MTAPEWYLVDGCLVYGVPEPEPEPEPDALGRIVKRMRDMGVTVTVTFGATN